MDNICNVCGAVCVKSGDSFVCPACGAVKLINAPDEKSALIYNANARLRLAYFDEAEELFRDICQKYPDAPEGWFGLTLSYYGIKFVEENGKSVPTCYIMRDAPLMESDYFKKALSYASPLLKEKYLETGAKIDKIRAAFFEKVKTVPDTDVFICFKDSDAETGKRTNDSYEAQNLYTFLTQKGYNAFYSRESLKNYLAEDYEPYIYNALSTSKVMIVLGSDLAYFDSNWLKNEWERYYAKIRLGIKADNSLIVVYDNVDPARLPKPLNRAQAVDLNSKTCYIDLLKHVEKVINKSRENKTVERFNVGTVSLNRKLNEIAFSEVSLRKLGQKYSELKVEEENVIKLVEKFIENGLFDNAKANLDTLKDSASAKSVYGNYSLLTENSVKNLCELIDKRDVSEKEIISAISDLPEEKALPIIQCAADYSYSALNKYALKRAITAFKTASAFAFGGRNEYVAKFIGAFVVVAPRFNDEEIDGAFSALREAVPNKNAEEQLMLCLSFGDSLLSAAKFSAAEKYYTLATEIDEYNKRALSGIIDARQKCADKANCYYDIEYFKDFDLLEKLLKSCENKNEQKETLVKFMSECIREAKSEPLNSGESEHINQLNAVFDRLLTFVPEGYDGYLIECLIAYADALINRGKFESAEKYFALVTAENKSEEEAFWGLMKARLKCRSDYELTTQNVSISSRPEFNAALLAASDDDNKVNEYIEIAKKQERFMKNADSIKQREALQEELAKATVRREREEARIFAEKHNLNENSSAKKSGKEDCSYTVFDSENCQKADNSEEWWTRKRQEDKDYDNDVFDETGRKVKETFNGAVTKVKSKLKTADKTEFKTKQKHAEHAAEKPEESSENAKGIGVIGGLIITLTLAASLVALCLDVKAGLISLVAWLAITRIIVVLSKRKR